MLDEGSTQSVYDQISERIADGILSPGSWIREASLAESLGTSRTPVREALRTLAAEGAVEVLKNRGVRVRVWSEEEIAETYALRALLEGYAARLACTHRTDEQLATLSTIHARLELAVERREPGFLNRLAEENAQFHATILEMAASPLLTSFIRTLSSVTVVRRAFRGYSEHDIARTVSSHRDVLLGISTRSPALAEAAMASHILAAQTSADTALRT